MAMSIVDLLEVVEVNHHNAVAAAKVIAVINCLMDLVFRIRRFGSPVRKSRNASCSNSTARRSMAFTRVTSAKT
jgi:hypothetical protein